MESIRPAQVRGDSDKGSVRDVEMRKPAAKSGTYIDTEAIPTGTSNGVYERKVAVMNQALIDLGMGRFQWKIYALTGFGWFVDNVSQLPGVDIFPPRLFLSPLG